MLQSSPDTFLSKLNHIIMIDYLSHLSMCLFSLLMHSKLSAVLVARLLKSYLNITM